MEEIQVRLILIGLPGSGKSTQGSLLSEILGIPHISVGDRIRAKVHCDSSTLASDIRAHWQSSHKLWQPLPDELMIAAVRQFINNQNAWILDGFPRNLEQVNWLSQQHKLDLVVWLDISEQTSINRVLARKRDTDTLEKVRSRSIVELHRFDAVQKFYATQNLLIRIDAEQCQDNITDKILKAIDDNIS